MILAVPKEVDEAVDFENDFDPERWGIPRGTSRKIRGALDEFHLNFRQCFATKTCNNYHFAEEYLKALIAMETGRNFANMTRRMDGIDATADGLQHFMSNSPWSPQPAYDKIQEQVVADGEFNGGVLSIDESCDKRNSENCAGASVQYNGRLGKKEMSQTAVCLGYYNLGVWTMISGELYMAEKWFTDEYAELREKVGIPNERKFITKPKMALQQIERAVKNGVKCEVVVGDTNYGRDGSLRKRLAQMGLNYLLDVPSATLVYLKKPELE